MVADVAAGRRGRRRAETRARLLRAARAVIAEKGVEATAIADITEAADVGFGTFYNYFPSKDAVAAAAIDDTLEIFGRQLDDVTGAVDDPAEVIAVAVRHFARRTHTDPVWAAFVVQVGLAEPSLYLRLGTRLGRDIDRAVAAGRFPRDVLPLAHFTAGGAVLHGMRALLLGAVEPDDPDALAVQVLRLLGLPNREATRIAHRPLPSLPTSEDA